MLHAPTTAFLLGMCVFQARGEANRVFLSNNIDRTDGLHHKNYGAHAQARPRTLLSLSQIMEYLTITLHHLFCPHTRIAPRFTQRPAARAGSSNSLLSLSVSLLLSHLLCCT